MVVTSAQDADSATIVAEGLTKAYGTALAVDSLDLEIRAGEIFGFLGPNGAGKTTTIRMLVGLLRPTSGTVRVAGVDLSQDPESARAQIAYVPDTPYLYEKLTGKEFLHFVAGLYSVPSDLASRRIDQLLALLGLEDYGDEMIERYSHGMRQKALIAAAMVHDPKVLFLDEPTVGLDPKSARLMQDIFRQLSRRGATVFLSTHLLAIAERMCDRIGIIDNGKLIALGTVAELHERSDRKGDLEDLFLQLTGGPEAAEVAEILA